LDGITLVYGLVIQTGFTSDGMAYKVLGFEFLNDDVNEFGVFWNAEFFATG
jgi:hypothetical protein